MMSIIRTYIQKLSKLNWTFVITWCLIFFIGFKLWSWVLNLLFQSYESIF